MFFRKDKRIKGCSNPKCKRAKSHYHYNVADNYCSLCKSDLTFVCSKCFQPFEPDNKKVTVCNSCLEKKAAKKAKKKEAAADIIRAAGAVGRLVTDKNNPGNNKPGKDVTDNKSI